MLVSLITFIVCCINPNAISMIYAISGPLIAMILFIMPTLSTYLIPALKPWRSIGNLITLIVGILCVSVMLLADIHCEWFKIATILNHSSFHNVHSLLFRTITSLIIS